MVDTSIHTAKDLLKPFGFIIHICPCQLENDCIHVGSCPIDYSLGLKNYFEQNRDKLFSYMKKLHDDGTCRCLSIKNYNPHDTCLSLQLTLFCLFRVCGNKTEDYLTLVKSSVILTYINTFLECNPAISLRIFPQFIVKSDEEEYKSCIKSALKKLKSLFLDDDNYYTYYKYRTGGLDDLLVAGKITI